MENKIYSRIVFAIDSGRKILPGEIVDITVRTMREVNPLRIVIPQTIVGDFKVISVKADEKIIDITDIDFSPKSTTGELKSDFTKKLVVTVENISDAAATFRAAAYGMSEKHEKPEDSKTDTIVEIRKSS